MPKNGKNMAQSNATYMYIYIYIHTQFHINKITRLSILNPALPWRSCNEHHVVTTMICAGYLLVRLCLWAQASLPEKYPLTIAYVGLLTLVGPIWSRARSALFFAVIRSHPIARSDSSYCGFFCTHAISIALQSSQFRSHFIPASKIDQKTTPVLDSSGKWQVCNSDRVSDRKRTNPRSIACPFAEDRDPIAAPGLLDC